MADHLLFEFTMVTTDDPVLLPVGAKIISYYDDVNDLISVYKNGVLWYAPGAHIGVLSGATRVWPPPPVPPPPPPRSYKVTGGSRGRGNPLEGGGDPNVYYSIFTYCRGGDYLQFTTNAIAIGNLTWPFTLMNEQLLSPLCCDINPLDFTLEVTHASAISPPNGKITITNAVEDEALFEMLVDGLLPYVPGSGGKIEKTGVAPGLHVIMIRRIGTSCYFTLNTEVNDISAVPQMEIKLITAPPLFSPVFSEVTYQWQFINGNSITLSSMPLTIPPVLHLSRLFVGFVGSDKREYFNKHKKIRIVDSGVYNGTWDVIDTGALDYIVVNVPYSGDMTIRYVPFEKVEFDLYAEVGDQFSTFSKIAKINASCDDMGIYHVRVEGYLQSVFDLKSPALTGGEITLSRKYYMEPVVASVYNNNNGGFKTAIYASVDSLTPYLEPLVPLGPGPMNFINEQSGRGMPVLFSILDSADGRIKNIISQSEEDIVTSSPIVNVAMIPLSTHVIRWLHSANITSLNVTPALPPWIIILPGPANEVNLQINAFTSSPGDYDPADYDEDDYLVYSFNSIVGCYSYTFKDGSTTLFVLNICIYPAQQVNKVCAEDAVSIAWVNIQGGWSSYTFGKGRKTKNIEIGSFTDFKRKGVLKKNSVDDVYEGMSINYAVLTPRELEFITSLRYSIEAYMYNDLTKQWDIPIYIDRANSTIYSLPFRQAEVVGQLTFKYAREIKIQRQ